MVRIVPDLTYAVPAAGDSGILVRTLLAYLLLVP